MKASGRASRFSCRINRIGVMVLGIIFTMVFSSSGFGQVAPKQSGTVPADQLTGFYQMPNNAAFIHFETKGDQLFAKQLWDNKEYQLVRQEGTTFETLNEGHKVEFIKDAAGSFSRARILGRIVTRKVDFDPRKTIRLTASQLGRLEGTYTFTSDSKFQLTIKSSGTGLTLTQLWDNKVIEFTPRTEMFFLNGDGTFPLTFLSEGGKVTRVTCFENDVWVKQ